MASGTKYVAPASFWDSAQYFAQDFAQACARLFDIFCADLFCADFAWILRGHFARDFAQPTFSIGAGGRKLLCAGLCVVFARLFDTRLFDTRLFL